MAELIAETGVPWVLMHWRGHSREMYAAARYGDVVTEVCAELTARVEDVVAAGVSPRQLVLDPGLGFAKRAEHNWTLRSEEHTSELQSRQYLVCRLLLEKRKRIHASIESIIVLTAPL